ncbi:uncharacterized protein AAGF69_008549 isoform 1-T1 [Amazona ochrocephala]
MQQDAASFTSATTKKELEWQTKETPLQNLKTWLEEREKDLIKDMQIKISHLAEQLKQVEPIGLPQGKKVENCPCSRTPKEKNQILEEKGLVMQQDKILEDMQIKISHLAEQLKQVEPIGLPQGKKVENCPCSRTPKIQKSTGHYLRKLTLYFGIFLWLLDRLLLSTDRLCIALVLFSKHGPEPTWLDWILNGIFHQHNRSYLWPH